MTDTPSRKLAVILHADVVDSTPLVRLNETIAHERIQDTFRRFSEAITGHDGIAHEIRGDALVAEFSRASDAVAIWAVSHRSGLLRFVQESRRGCTPGSQAAAGAETGGVRPTSQQY